MEDLKVFEEYLELPEGYQVQLMVLRDFPGGRKRRGTRMTVFRSRIWVGHESEEEPLLHCSQEHTDCAVAIDACYSMLLNSVGREVHSVLALEAVADRVHRHFCGKVAAV